MINYCIGYTILHFPYIIIFNIYVENPKVVSVFLSKEHKLHTTRSWEFLGLRGNDMNSAWQKGRFGENTIIANIDSGTKLY
jgi:hypothetical protein